MGVFDVINEQGKRTYDLERDQVRGNPTTIVVGTLVVLGVPDSGAVTNPCKPRTSATLHEVTLELPLGETSPTDVTFDILKSGVSVGSVTITAGDDEGVALIDVGFSRGDQLTVQATTPGSGYTSMTGHLVWQTTRDWWHPPVLMFNVASTPTTVALDVEVGEGSGWRGLVELGSMELPAGSVTVNITGTAENAPLSANLQCAYQLVGPDTIGDVTVFSFTGDDTTVVVADPQTLTGGSYAVAIAFRVMSPTDSGTVVDFTFSVT
jgi:hypothetical protein